MYEKVNPQHPDKIADRIAGAIVDLAYSKEKGRLQAQEAINNSELTEEGVPELADEQ